MITRGERALAGMMKQPQEQVDMGLPPMWNTYIATADMDATIAKVEAAGGSVMTPPFDVMDGGRMAVVADPPERHSRSSHPARSRADWRCRCPALII